MSLARMPSTATLPGSDLPSRLCAEALQWVGTPYRHHASLRGKGADCVGLLIGIAKACGCLSPNWQPPLYSPQWHLHQQAEMLTDVLAGLSLIEKPVQERLPGDVLVFQYTRRQARRILPASHVGLAMPGDYVVHAIVDDQVRHHSLTGTWLANLRRVYMFPEGTL